LILCTDVNDIPDFVEKAEEAQVSGGSVIISHNRNYYRQLVEYIKHLQLQVPLRIGASNLANVGTRDVLMNVGLRTDDGLVDIRVNAPERPDRNNIHYHFVSDADKGPVLELCGMVDGYQEVKIEFPVIQASRTLLSNNALFLETQLSTMVHIKGTIYSTTLPPVYFEKSLNIRIMEKRLPFREILAKVGESPDS